MGRCAELLITLAAWISILSLVIAAFVEDSSTSSASTSTSMTMASIKNYPIFHVCRLILLFSSCGLIICVPEVICLRLTMRVHPLRRRLLFLCMTWLYHLFFGFSFVSNCYLCFFYAAQTNFSFVLFFFNAVLLIGFAVIRCAALSRAVAPFPVTGGAGVVGVVINPLSTTVVSSLSSPELPLSLVTIKAQVGN